MATISLDELMQRPERAAGLSEKDRREALLHIASLLVMLAVGREPESPVSSRPAGRAISLKEVAERLSMNVRTARRNPLVQSWRLPGPGFPRYAEAALEVHLQKRVR